MAHKLSWILLTAGVFGTGVFASRFVSMSGPGRSAAASAPADQQALVERLERLEAGLPKLQQNVAAQMGAVALNAAAAVQAAGTESAGTSTSTKPQLSSAAYAEKERAHYDQLDALVKKGGGSAATAQLRKNIEGARANKDKRLALDVRRLDCSDALCRVEVRTNGDSALVMNGARVLSAGMGDLSMRPRTQGQPDVYYVAAPGLELPPFDF
jgi:hypothetical protein